MPKKIHSGYEKKKPKSTDANLTSDAVSPSTDDSQKNERNYAANLIIVDRKNRIPIGERIVKLLILIALRIVIKPSKWKDSKKNYALIDHTYARIMSADFIYIPSSIAFYIVMAFMPIISLILLVNKVPFMQDVLNYTNSSGVKVNAIGSILGDFIPGMSEIIEQMTNASNNNTTSTAAYVATISTLVVSAWIASGGFSKLIFTMSHIYGYKLVGGYWANKFRGIFMVLALTLYLAIGLAINVSVDRSITTSSMSHGFKNFVRNAFLVVGLFLLVFLGFGFMYRFSPRFKTKIRWILPGTMTTTLPIVFFLALFGSITSLWNYGEFGVVGAIMYLSMASLLITYFIFIGIIVNASYHKTFIGKIEKKWTLSKK